MTELKIIVPCYNEEAVLHDTTQRLLHVLGKLIREEKITDNSSIVFIDDGSSSVLFVCFWQSNRIFLVI